MADLEQRIRALEERLRILEDQFALLQIMSSYGPAVDSGAGEFAAALWTTDGVYDAQVGSWKGREAIAGMVAGAMHQNLIQNGCAHVIGMPLITIDRDQAVATCYARLYRRELDGFKVWRVTANRWEFERSSGRWEVTHRVNRLLDGNEDARQLLRQGLTSKS